jgi:hypothetical protein
MNDSDNPRLGIAPTFEDELMALHEMDMVGAIEDPRQVPKAPDGTEEGITDQTGTHEIDIERDSDRIDESVVDSEIGVGQPIIDVDLMGFEDLEPKL